MGPTFERRLRSDSLPISLRDDSPPPGDNEGCGQCLRPESGVNCLPELRFADLAIQGCITDAVTHGPVHRRLVLEAEELKAIRAPVLGIFGTRDRSLPPEMADEFEKALSEARVRHTILRYDADHAFANPSGARYDEKAAAAAWEQTRKFLAANLKPAK